MIPQGWCRAQVPRIAIHFPELCSRRFGYQTVYISTVPQMPATYQILAVTLLYPLVESDIYIVIDLRIY